MNDVSKLVSAIVSGDNANAEEHFDSIIRQKIVDRIDDVKADVLANPYEPRFSEDDTEQD